MKIANHKTVIEGFKVKQFGLRKYDNESASYIVAVKVPQGKRIKDYQFYLDNLERRCHCSYDCCGHYFSSIMNIKRKGRTIEYYIGVARNY